MCIRDSYIPDKNRGTLCVSSQVGCGLNCTFCSTATQGFNRNLTTAEIIGQVWVTARHLGNVPAQNRRLTNVVMMGMGEPLLNFDNVVRAMNIMRDDLGYGLASKRVTLSTSGLVPMIDRLSTETDVSLAVSLHAPNDALREQLVPLNRKYPIAELMASCVRYLRANKKRDSVTFEYTLMTVSYTHLDVYKRQPSGMAQPMMASSMRFRSMPGAWATTDLRTCASMSSGRVLRLSLIHI